MLGHQSSEPQTHLMRILVRTAGPTRWRRWVIVSTGVMVLASVGAWWYLHEDPFRRAAGLLAQAYSAGRTFEWRLPDAGWAPSSAARTGNFDRPRTLFEAQALLAGVASAHENDPQWLGLRARAEILELRAESAIALLQRALPASGKPADLLGDLSAAYGLNAESFDRPAEFAAAVEFSTRALAINPQQRVALFNRAVAFERLQMVDRAVEDWERYLQIERDPRWSQEARSRLDQLRSVQERRARLLASDEPSDAVLESKAVAWLKQDRARAREAAKALVSVYDDSWLAEAAQESVDSAPLLQAVNSVIAGRVDEALQLSRQAARLYAERAAPAHLARAQLETVNALNRSMDSKACRDLASSLAAKAAARSYHWIHIQALLQQGGCSGMLGNIGLANDYRREAIGLARQHRMAGLEFRAVGLDASLRTASGDLWAAWRDNREILGRVLDSPISAYRIQQCLVNYSSSADLWGWHAASYHFMKAAADALRSTPNRITEAACRARAAAVALEAHLNEEYAEEARRAAELFRGLPESETRSRYLNSVQLLEGQSYLLAGRPADATRVLAPVAEAAVLQREQWQAHQFLGLGLLRTGDRTGAVSHLRSATDILDRRVATLPRAAERSQARREGLDAYRALAEVLLDEDPSGSRSLRVWLAAHGSTAAPDLVFLALANGYAVWTDHGARLHRLQRDRSRIQHSISGLLSAATDPLRPVSGIQREGRFLFDELLGADLGVMPLTGTVTVLPDAEIAVLPFQLLVEPDGRWLADRLTTVFAARPRAAGEFWSPPLRALVVGAPATKELLPALPDSRLEAESLAARFAGSTLLMGADATASAVTQALEGADLFHYSGHGYAGASVGGLYLSNSLLTSASLQGLSLRACRLVVLAACLTAVGQSNGLTNPDSLVHTFLDVGAHTAIASRWAVDSPATAALMERFYLDLGATRDPAKALSSSTAALRAEAKYRHPYYWAAFQTYE